jgi:8-amino-7-oxononanoate synthase
MMPIQTITLGSPELAMKIQKLALDKKLFVQAIRYPTVPKNKDLIRINITSNHTKKHIKELLIFLANQLV